MVINYLKEKVTNWWLNETPRNRLFVVVLYASALGVAIAYAVSQYHTYEDTKTAPVYTTQTIENVEVPAPYIAVCIPSNIQLDSINCIKMTGAGTYYFKNCTERIASGRGLGGKLTCYLLNLASTLGPTLPSRNSIEMVGVEIHSYHPPLPEGYQICNSYCCDPISPQLCNALPGSSCSTFTYCNDIVTPPIAPTAYCVEYWARQYFNTSKYVGEYLALSVAPSSTFSPFWCCPPRTCHDGGCAPLFMSPWPYMCEGQVIEYVLSYSKQSLEQHVFDASSSMIDSIPGLSISHIPTCKSTTWNVQYVELADGTKALQSVDENAFAETPDCTRAMLWLSPRTNTLQKMTQANSLTSFGVVGAILAFASTLFGYVKILKGKGEYSKDGLLHKVGLMQKKSSARSSISERDTPLLEVRS